MKKILSAILITILAFSIVCATSVYAVTNMAIQTNSDYQAGKLVGSKDFITTVGSKIQLYARLIDSGEVTGNPLTGVQWSTSNVQVVAISETGMITALKAGTSTITASYNGGSDTIKITVEAGTPGSDLPTGEDENQTGGGGSSGGGSSQDQNQTGGGGSGSGGSGGSGSGGSSSGGTAIVEEGFIDFSNAKFEVKKEGVSGAILEVTGAKSIPEGGYISTYLFFTETAAKPTIEGENVNGEKYSSGVALSKSDDNSSILKSNDKDIAKYVELKKDYYMAVVQYKSKNEAPYYDLKVLSYGTKLVRPAEPQYTDSFFATFISYDSNQIITTFTHNNSNNRKMKIKIGKVTDTSILNKIKNQDSSGFSSLLTYAKSNSGIYDQAVNADENYYAIGYNAGNTSDGSNQTLIDLKGKLNNDDYYYLYVKTDDENGKYNSYEGITLAQGQVHDNGNWYLFFYGTDNFKWTDWGTSEGNDVLNGNVTKDPTTPDGKLPQTGVGAGITASIVTTMLLTIISFVVYTKNKDLR